MQDMDLRYMNQITKKEAESEQNIRDSAVLVNENYSFEAVWLKSFKVCDFPKFSYPKVTWTPSVRTRLQCELQTHTIERVSHLSSTTLACCECFLVNLTEFVWRSRAYHIPDMLGSRSTKVNLQIENVPACLITSKPWNCIAFEYSASLTKLGPTFETLQTEATRREGVKRKLTSLVLLLNLKRPFTFSDMLPPETTMDLSNFSSQPTG